MIMMSILLYTATLLIVIEVKSWDCHIDDRDAFRSKSRTKLYILIFCISMGWFLKRIGTTEENTSQKLDRIIKEVDHVQN